jgi:hypothetical protein
MTIEELSARLEKVERQNRWMRAGGIAALVLVAAGAAMGQAAAPPKVIQAERFEVRDAGGKTRAVLGINPEGVAELALHDKIGEPRIGMDVAPEGPSRAWLGEAGKRGIMLFQTPDGSPALGLSDKEGNPRIGLFLTPDGSPALKLFDEGNSGKARAGIVLLADGSPAVILSDRDGTFRAALGVAELEGTKAGAKERTAPSSLVLFGKDGKVLFRAPQ